MIETLLRAIYARAWEAMQAEIRAFFEQTGPEGALSAEAAARRMSPRELRAWRHALLEAHGEVAPAYTLAEALAREPVTRAEALALLLRERSAMLRVELDAAGILGDRYDPLLRLSDEALACAEGGLTESGVLALAEDAMNASQTRRETGETLLGGALYYVVEAVDDEKSCCSGVSGLILSAGDAEIGENFPPFHPNCRCTVRAEEMGRGEMMRTDVSKSEGKRATDNRDDLFALLKGYNDLLGNMDDMFLAHAKVAVGEEEEQRRILKLLKEADEFWRQEENYEKFIQYIKDWMAGLVDAPEDWRELYFAARGAQLGREQLRPFNYLLPSMEEGGYSREALIDYLLYSDIPGLRKADKRVIANAILALENEAITKDWLQGNAANKDGRMISDLEVFARVLYAEQSAVLYNQVESFYVFVNRLFDTESHRAGNEKTIFKVVKAPGQFTPYKEPRSDSPALKPDNDMFWENAKLLAGYAYVLFGEKTRDQLLDEYKTVVDRKDATYEDAYDYYMKILGQLPDVTGVPIGIFANREVFFSSTGGDDLKVAFINSSKKRVNLLRRGQVNMIQFSK